MATTAPKRQTQSAIDLFGKSYGIFKRNFGLYLLLYSIPFLFTLWDSLDRYGNDNPPSRSWNNWFGSGVLGPAGSSPFYDNAGVLIALLVIPFIISQLMLEVLNLRAAQGRQPTFKQLWTEFTANWLWLKLMALMLLVVLIVVAGFIALIVAGVILLWRLFLAPYILIDQKVGIEESIRRSWRLTKGYGWPIYSVLLVSLAIALFNVVPLLGAILAAILGAIYSIAPALRYWEIHRSSS